MTAAKKPSHTFQPTPVRSAMTSMRFMVPRSRSRVESKVSFIFSANAEESRISSPIATVIYPYVELAKCSSGCCFCAIIKHSAAAAVMHRIPRPEYHMRHGMRRWIMKAREHTSFRILTFPNIPSTCWSFWLSSSLSTASLYCPLCHENRSSAQISSCPALSHSSPSIVPAMGILSPSNGILPLPPPALSLLIRGLVPPRSRDATVKRTLNSAWPACIPCSLRLDVANYCSRRHCIRSRPAPDWRWRWR